VAPKEFKTESASLPLALLSGIITSIPAFGLATTPSFLVAVYTPPQQKRRTWHVAPRSNTARDPRCAVSEHYGHSARCCAASVRARGRTEPCGASAICHPRSRQSEIESLRCHCKNLYVCTCVAYMADLIAHTL
jgi:hypothetical protein